MSLKLNFIAASDRGLMRDNNEDSAYAGPHLLVLADGMGGHAAGEIASQLMVRHMEHLDRDPEDADVLALLGAAAEDANAAIRDSVDDNPEQEGMGTTLTALMFNGAEVGLIHVGDSRGYMLREGSLNQITEDDTFVQSLVKEGKLDPGDVSSHPQKSLILKAYTGRPVDPHLEMIPVRAGDRFMLCSDGLSDPVTSSTIEETLREGSPQVAAQRLIELALRSGGPDNITVVIADVVDTEEPEAPQLPTAPAIVGALVPDDEPSHPDSSASRAAALMRSADVPGAPVHTATLKGRRDSGSSTTQLSDAPSDDEEAHARRSIWPWVVALLAVAVVGTGSLAWLNSRAEDTYYVAVNADNDIAIQQSEGSIFGNKDRTDFQLACINDKNELRITGPTDLPEGCRLFTTGDLPESEKSAMEDFSGGSYEEAVALMNRLAGRALPVCVDKADAKPGDAATAQPGEAGAARNCRTVK